MSDLNVLGINLEEATEDQRFKLGAKVEVGNTTYIYLKNKSVSATELGAVFSYDAINFTWEAWASQANLSGKSRPLATFNRALNKGGTLTDYIPLGYYAWAAVEGKMKVIVLTLCAKDVPLYTSATAGYLDDTSTTQTLIQGLTITATNSGGSSATMDAYAVNAMRC